MTAKDIIIIGGGIAGAAMAYEVARSGAGSRVLVLEREASLGQHATGQNAAILRTAIDAWATRQLAYETARFLRAPPQAFVDRPLLESTGVLVAEGTPGEAEPAWVADHLTWGEVERVDATRVAKLAAAFRPIGTRAWWFPRQGVIDVALLLDSFAAGARAAGVQIRTHAPVARLLVESDRVVGVVLESGEVLRAAHTVIAAGGWAKDLGAQIGKDVSLTVTRRHLLVGAPDRAIDPRMPVVWDDRANFYARPESGGLLVSACDVDEIDPDHLVSDADVKVEVAEKVARLLPAFANLRVANFWPGLRTLSPDDVPIVGPDTRRPGLFWMAGLGGHGITVSVGVGRLAAALLTDAAVDPRLAAAASPQRFAQAAAAG